MVSTSQSSSVPSLVPPQLQPPPVASPVLQVQVTAVQGEAQASTMVPLVPKDNQGRVMLCPFQRFWIECRLPSQQPPRGRLTLHIAYSDLLHQGPTAPLASWNESIWRLMRPLPEFSVLDDPLTANPESKETKCQREARKTMLATAPPKQTLSLSCLTTAVKVKIALHPLARSWSFDAQGVIQLEGVWTLTKMAIKTLQDVERPTASGAPYLDHVSLTVSYSVSSSSSAPDRFRPSAPLLLALVRG